MTPTLDLINLQLDPDMQLRVIALMAAATALAGSRSGQPTTDSRYATIVAQGFYEWLRAQVPPSAQHRPQDR